MLIFIIITIILFIYLFFFFLQFRDFSNSYNGCPYTRLLSNTSCVKAIRSKISSNFTLHLSKVAKLKQLFKKVSSNLKNHPYDRLNWLAVSWTLREAKHVNQS